MLQIQYGKVGEHLQILNLLDAHPLEMDGFESDDDIDA